MRLRARKGRISRPQPKTFKEGPSVYKFTTDEEYDELQIQFDQNT